jgi:outer membrane protein assembly factor BamB
MSITVICPRCESRFTLEEQMRGQRIRCPNQLCRNIFEVRAEGDKPAAAPATPPAPPPPEKPVAVKSGSVTEMLPLLPAEIAEPPVEEKKPPERAAPRRLERTPEKPARPKEPPAPKPSEAPALMPPPVRSSAAPATVTAPPADFPDDFPGDDDADSMPAAGAGPPEVGPGTWEAPPVRGPAVEVAPQLEVAAVATALAAPAELPAPAHRGRRVLLIIAAMLVLFATTILGGWRYVENARAGSEADRFNRAEEHYKQAEFEDATTALQKLAKDFPSSRDAPRYRFLAELSSVRGEADKARDLAELKSALDHVLQFLGFNQQEALLKDRHADVWDTLKRLAERLADQADEKHDRDALAMARHAWKETGRLEPPSQVNVPQVQRALNDKFEQVTARLDVFERRLAVIDALKERVAKASAQAVQEGRALVTAAGLTDDGEAKDLLADLVLAHRAAIRYVPAEGTAANGAIDDDALPSLVVTPALTAGKASPGRGVALALARGVLYAFDPERGELRWARRVGMDTTVLPLRVPADVITPELLLVLSSDSQSIAALVADTGTLAWQHALEQPCKGQPVLIGQSLLIPTVAGRVDEVEIRLGRLLGHYELGQRLTVGGVRQPGTSLVYFPGDEFCIYVLDVSKRACEAVLYANHPAGSLRGVPVILPGRKLASPEAAGGKGPTGWLLLCQARGTSATEVRGFELPIRSPDQKALDPMLHVRGLSWFAPWHDAEKLALATDKGYLWLWGIRQEGNDDPLLFPLLEDPYQVGAGPGRAQVAHADADAYWVLTGGRLHRLDSVFRPASGPGLIPAWPQPPLLGSPLHACQHHRDEQDRFRLIVTTLGLDRPTCLTTAVDAASGKFAWQRQLGCVPLQPLAVQGGRVLLRDTNGLLLLDPERHGEQAWQHVGDFHAQEPLGPDDQVVILTGASEFVQLAWSSRPGAARLRVRQVPLTGEGSSKVHDLPAPPAGTAALGDGCVLLPLADGIAVRVELAGTVAAGPNWRAVGADEQTSGHIVALDGGEFLLTDGSRGLMRVSWPSAKVYQQRAAAELGHRIVAAPAVLPAVGDARPRVCVADAADTLTLLDGERLQVVRRWGPLPGKITAGPFVRGTGIICVTDHKRLIWIDPDQAGPQWEYTLVSNLVGAPLLSDGMLITAEVSGRVLALDPKSGVPVGPGYTLRANIAAEAAPVPFGAGRLLVPLNDGTLVLLPLARLR